jgi:hypothetical protein
LWNVILLYLVYGLPSEKFQAVQIWSSVVWCVLKLQISENAVSCIGQNWWWFFRKPKHTASDKTDKKLSCEWRFGLPLFCLYIIQRDIINKDKQRICYFVQIVLDSKMWKVCHYLKVLTSNQKHYIHCCTWLVLSTSFSTVHSQLSYTLR